MAKDTIARALAIHAMSEPMIPLAGDGIDVSGGKINVKYDKNTINTNGSGELEVKPSNVAASLTGYDATKNQILKNNNGTLTWEDIEVYISLS